MTLLKLLGKFHFGGKIPAWFKSVIFYLTEGRRRNSKFLNISSVRLAFHLSSFLESVRYDSDSYVIFGKLQKLFLMDFGRNADVRISIRLTPI